MVQLRDGIGDAFYSQQQGFIEIAASYPDYLAWILVPCLMEGSTSSSSCVQVEDWNRINFPIILTLHPKSGQFIKKAGVGKLEVIAKS